MHRFDGAEQYFTRAVDFGYSFSIEETYEKWGRDEIIGDYVRLIRMVRPDLIFSMNPAGTGGGQHHQASAILAREAYRLAGDPTKYPEQLKEGLRPWSPKKFYHAAQAAAGQERVASISTAAYDPLLGKTYREIGAEERSMHKSQGMAQLLALPGQQFATGQLVESRIPGQMQRGESSWLDGIDTTIPGLAQFAGPRPPGDLVDGLAAIGSSVQDARKKFESGPPETMLQPLLTGLHAVRTLRTQLRSLTIDDAGRYDIDLRLRQKETEFQQAILLANAVRVEALADDGVVVPGQPVKVSVLIANNGASDVTVKQVKFSGFDGDAPCALTAVTAGVGRGGGGGGGRGGRGGAPAPPAPVISTLKKEMVARCEVALKIPSDARVSEPYWHRKGEAGRYTFDADAPFGLPFRPTPFNVQMTFTLAGGAEEEVVDALAVQYRYEGNIFSGEKRTELLVVPAFSVRVSPELAIIPTQSIGGASPASTSVRGTSRPDASGREIRVTVVNDGQSAGEHVVKLQLPPGWTATPPQQTLTFVRQDEAQTVRFSVKPAASTVPGEYHVRAAVLSGSRTYDRGYQTIEYPHIRLRHIYHDADVTLKVLSVKTAPNLSVGYIVGVGDEVPAAIEQLGARVEYITADDLAWGNLSRFNAIVTGVRAYERRPDLRANNGRLLEYVKAGGTLIVQYNKFEFNDAEYGPYPAKVGAFGGSGIRVTDEFAPVTVLAPGDPVMTVPNEISDATWRNWVQERGLYFLGDRDARYRDLVALEDPFPYNKGEKRGALVETSYGKGHWVYVGLGLWRQLPAGTDGAYQLLANLISLPKAPVPAPAKASPSRVKTKR